MLSAYSGNFSQPQCVIIGNSLKIQCLSFWNYPTCCYHHLVLGRCELIEHVILVAITRTIILVPYLCVTSLKLIWRWGTRTGALSSNELQIRDYMRGYQYNSSNNDYQGPVSKFDKKTYFKIWQSFKAWRFVFKIVWSLWYFTSTSAAVLPMCLSDFKAMR